MGFEGRVLDIIFKAMYIPHFRYTVSVITFICASEGEDEAAIVGADPWCAGLNQVDIFLVYLRLAQTG